MFCSAIFQTRNSTTQQLCTLLENTTVAITQILRRMTANHILKITEMKLNLLHKIN